MRDIPIRTLLSGNYKKSDSHLVHPKKIMQGSHSERVCKLLSLASGTVQAGNSQTSPGPIFLTFLTHSISGWHLYRTSYGLTMAAGTSRHKCPKFSQAKRIKLSKVLSFSGLDLALNLEPVTIAKDSSTLIYQAE